MVIKRLRIKFADVILFFQKMSFVELRKYRRLLHHYERIGNSPGKEVLEELQALFKHDALLHRRHDEGILSDIKCDKNKFEVRCPFSCVG